MNKLDAIRLSDRPGEVVQTTYRVNHSSDRYNMFIFSFKDKKFTYSWQQHNNIHWIAELLPYDKTKSFPQCVGNPGGYGRARLGLIMGNSPTVLDDVRQFIAETLAI